MAHALEVAKSGRSSCRTCNTNIPKDTLRFGEETQTPFSDQPSMKWHHLTCAAKSRPVLVEEVLASYTGEIPDREELMRTIEVSKKTQKPSEFPHADRAPTGRAKCIACREPIEKGSIRVAVERDTEPGGAYMGKSAAYLHPKCAKTSIQGEDALAKIRKNSPALEEDDVKELEAAFS
jgi:hypothetical protein